MYSVITRGDLFKLGEIAAKLQYAKFRETRPQYFGYESPHFSETELVALRAYALEIQDAVGYFTALKNDDAE